MKHVVVITLLYFISAAVGVSQTDSYQKQVVLEARHRAATLEARSKARAKMTMQELAEQSDFESYPTDLMNWGKGFADGLAKVTVHGLAGFINRQGRIVVKPTLKDAGKYSEGLAPFESGSGKWGFIDKAGAVAIKSRFDWALSFSENRALVQVGEKWGFIDRTGAIVIEPQFAEAGGFAEGLARVQLRVMGPLPGYAEERLIYKTGYIDRDGTWVIPPTWDGGDDFNGNMALVSRNIGYKNGVISESVFIDRSGSELWTLNSWFITRFQEDVLVIAVKDAKPNHDRYGIVGRDGRRLTEQTFEQISGFSEGVSWVKIDGKYEFIDKTGKLVIPARFEWSGDFSEGLAGAGEGGNRLGYIDRKGKFIIPPRFEWVGEFKNGFALVAEGNKTGYIDKTGKYIWKPTE
jgi:hypothetical protein